MRRGRRWLDPTLEDWALTDRELQQRKASFMRSTTCDTCGKERSQTVEGWIGWLKVEPHALEIEGGPWDFCSLACLTSWAAEATL